MSQLVSQKNSEQVGRRCGRSVVNKRCSHPNIELLYDETKIDPSEAERRLNMAFDILFEEVMKTNNTSGIMEQLGV